MEVVHDQARHRFVVSEGEARGALVYREAGPGVIELLHTEVDPPLRGRGVANDLARAAVDHARTNGLRVLPTCPFVQSWLRRHPEEADLVATS